MDNLCRQFLLPASEIFLGCDRHADSWKTVATKDGAESTTTEFVDDWKLFLSYCEALLEAGGIQPCSGSTGRVAVLISQVSANCYCAGFKEGVRRSAKAAAEKARIAKRERALERGRLVQRAIMAVCEQQQITPAASEKFAISIQAEVIESARQMGLADPKSGTSPRSLQRHIAAILERAGMP